MRSFVFLKKRTIAFRQWARKPFAIFNSLKVTIKISVMCVAYTLVNPFQETKAQSDSTQVLRKVELEDVEVSGQRAPVVYSQLARVVSVITRGEIEQAPVHHVNELLKSVSQVDIRELLKSVSQVDIRERGVYGSQADISIQGGSFDQTLILLNGVNLTDPQTGHYNLNLPIEIESIDRVEVLKGPASRVFGTNAFSGAVNFITGQDPNNYVKLSQMAGDFGLLRSAATVNHHTGTFHNLFSVSQTQSDGYIHNTDYNAKNAFYHGKLFVQQTNIGLQMGYIKKDCGANSFYSPLYPNQFDKTETYFGSINAETGEKLKVSPVMYWRRNYDHYILDYENPATYQNFHFTDVYGTGVNATLQTSVGKTSLGIEYRKEEIYSTSLGHSITPRRIPGQDTLEYTKGDWRENTSAYLEQNLYLGNFSASAGVMANRNTKLQGVKFYPGIDMSYKIWNGLKWYTSVNKSLRLPSFTDLYYKGRVNRGNPDLKPERAWTFESGVKYGQPGITGNISYFYRWGRDIIDWVKSQDSTVWHTMNYTRLDAYGIEFAVSITPGGLLPAVSFINSVSLSYSYTNQAKQTDALDSYYVLDHLKHKLVLSIAHRIRKNFGASWQFLWQDRNGTYNDYTRYDATTQTAPPNPYKSFLLVDGRIFYASKQINVFIEASNIFDQTYYDIGNIVQPGRWFKAGIELKLGI
jgi:vitamin B12 transporter